MNPTTCEREDQTSSAVLSGMVNNEIKSHARQCLICADILLVWEFLHEDASVAPHQRASPAEAALIWKKAQIRATEGALRAALRPVRFMKIIAVMAFVCSPALRWLLPMVRELVWSWTRNLDFNGSLAPRIWSATPSQIAILLGFAAATILLGLSSWYMARQE